MMMLWNIFLLVAGFVLLTKGADFFVEGSSTLAMRLRIPPIIVGVTVVSMGTSLPELAVSTTAALKGANEIAIANVIGSNFFNLLVVLGMAALLTKHAIPVQKSLLRCELPFNLLITVLLGMFSIGLILAGNACFAGHLWDPANGGVTTGSIGRLEGILLLILFVAYISWTVRAALRARAEALAAEADPDADTEVEEALAASGSLKMAIFFIALGAVMIKFGGDFVIESASYIAAALGMSQTLIGLTIVSCGTSLPELVTSVVAARKDQCDLAVGNVVGSNIFNILFILGVSGTIHPIAVYATSVIDLVLLLVVSIIGTILCATKKEVNRREGIVMILLYAVYLTYIILR